MSPREKAGSVDNWETPWTTPWPLCTGTVKLYGFRMHVGCYRYSRTGEPQQATSGKLHRHRPQGIGLYQGARGDNVVYLRSRLVGSCMYSYPLLFAVVCSCCRHNTKTAAGLMASEDLFGRLYARLFATS